jgi:protease-4
MRQRAIQTLVGVMLMASCGCVYVSGEINPFAKERGGLRETTVFGMGRDKVLLLDISGIITGMERKESLGLVTEESTVARLEEELRRARDDKRVHAVVLRINSPGGGVTASDTIYREIMRFKEETQRPVVAALGDVATSGAYYIALAADQIVASPTTVTGSIGVIVMGLSVQGLMAKLGIRDQTIKSGDHKDLLSPFRDATAEEREIVQSVIDELQGRFIGLVVARRPAVSSANLGRLGDGRIFTASQGAELGLVDQIGYIEDAVEAATQAAGIEQARVVMYHRQGEYRENLYSGASLLPGLTPPTARGTETLGVGLGLPRNTGPRFMYLWVPGLAASP